MKKTLLSVSLASLFAAGTAAALEMRPVLRLAVAKKMAAACEARGAQEGWKMNIAIMDAGGVHIGSIGVSGARADQDGVCAQAALDAVANDLR